MARRARRSGAAPRVVTQTPSPRTWMSRQYGASVALGSNVAGMELDRRNEVVALRLTHPLLVTFTGLPGARSADQYRNAKGRLTRTRASSCSVSTRIDPAVPHTST